MEPDISLAMLGGLSPRQFMKRHWQRKPLLVRRAFEGFAPLLTRGELFALAARDDVESRLVRQAPRDGTAGQWRMRRGPFARRSLPPLSRPLWTLLVQGVDLHDDAVHSLLARFRFVPDARLDDLMISFATDGGGVGPHLDSYDVFLLQAHGRRRWRIGPQKDKRLVQGLPLKILANFEPREEFVLEPGDMLYLPPGYAHDGVALGECMTYSIGFRVPSRGELAREMLQRLAEDAGEAAGDALYRDAGAPPVDAPGHIPADLLDFTRKALARALDDPDALPRALGEYLTEPKANVWFGPDDDEEGDDGQGQGATGGEGRATRVPRARLASAGVRLDRRTRMMYDARHVFVNGESWRAAGRDAALMRRLADARALAPRELASASRDALELLAAWQEAGWLHAGDRR